MVETLKHMGYSSRKIHHLSPKNRKLRSQFTQELTKRNSPKSRNKRSEKLCLVWWVLVSLLWHLLMAASSIITDYVTKPKSSWTWPWCHCQQISIRPGTNKVNLMKLVLRVDLIKHWQCCTHDQVMKPSPLSQPNECLQNYRGLFNQKPSDIKKC